MCAAAARGGAGKDPRRKNGALNNPKNCLKFGRKEEKGMDDRRRQRWNGEEGKRAVWSPEEVGEAGVAGVPCLSLHLPGRGPGSVCPPPPPPASGPPGSGRRAIPGPSPGPSPGRAGLRGGRRPGAAASFVKGEFGRRGEKGQYL